MSAKTTLGKAMRGICFSRWILGALLGAWAVVSVVGPAKATTWTFVQSGWKEFQPPIFVETGGVVTGFFSGTDLDLDGVLERSEVTDYSMRLEGDSIFPDFSHDLEDLKFFEYTIGSSGFPPSFPLYSYNGLYAYDADDGVINIPLQPDGLGIGLPDPALVTLVPLPPGMALYLAALAALGLALRAPAASFRSAFVKPTAVLFHIMGRATRCAS